jgi:hypothetical protein
MLRPEVLREVESLLVQAQDADEMSGEAWNDGKYRESDRWKLFAGDCLNKARRLDPNRECPLWEEYGFE